MRTHGREGTKAHGQNDRNPSRRPQRLGRDPGSAENRENAGDYVQALVEREHERQLKIVTMDKLFEEGLASGNSDLTMDEIRKKALTELRAEAIHGLCAFPASIT